MDLSSHPHAEQLDFWLGKWQVTDPSGLTGSNHVTRILNDRVIQENFSITGDVNFQGISLSSYNTRLARWEQTWVDTDGNYWTFTGGADGDTFRLSCEDVREGRKVVLRMVFYNIQQDNFDWRWEQSFDQGTTWEERWHLHYERLK